MYCKECKTEEISIGCPYCLKDKVKKLQEDLMFYKRELELIKEK